MHVTLQFRTSPRAHTGADHARADAKPHRSRLPAIALLVSAIAAGTLLGGLGARLAPPRMMPPQATAQYDSSPPPATSTSPVM